MEVLPLCREAVGVFSSTSLVGHIQIETYTTEFDSAMNTIKIDVFLILFLRL